MKKRNIKEAGLLEALLDIPIMDTHTHLTVDKLGARGLHDILLYHMVISELYSAGCPSGARLTEFPGWPTMEEAHTRLGEVMPYLKHVQNTSCFWGVRMILKDLYQWDQAITNDNWRKLDEMIRERADDKSWQREIMRRTKLAKLTTELARRGKDGGDGKFHYSMEWAFFTRTQRNEFDTALYELERCWGKTPASPIPHAVGKRPPPERVILTLDDVHSAISHYVEQLVASPVISMATHISTDIAFRKVTDAEMASALARRAKAGVTERDIYASYIHETFLKALGPYGDRIVFQFSLAAEPLPHETASLIPQRAIADIAEVAACHPMVKFHCLLASRHANQSLCTLCRELPNISMAGYWWHNFFPGAMRQIMEERLDMLPLNKQVGFFSDAYCLEWTYAKAMIVLRQLAQVLSRKIAQGQYTIDGALTIARAILFETPQELLRMTPPGREA